MSLSNNCVHSVTPMFCFIDLSSRTFSHSLASKDNERLLTKPTQPSLITINIDDDEAVGDKTTKKIWLVQHTRIN